MALPSALPGRGGGFNRPVCCDSTRFGSWSDLCLVLSRENLGTGYELEEWALSESRDGWFAKAVFLSCR